MCKPADTRHIANCHSETESELTIVQQRHVVLALNQRQQLSLVQQDGEIIFQSQTGAIHVEAAQRRLTEHQQRLELRHHLFK